MIIVKGKYCEARIYTDVVDEASIAQIQELCNQEFTAGQRLCLMPDIHAGKGCTIGTTMTIGDKIVPNLVGVDIGCGMHVCQLDDKNVDMARLDAVIREFVPAGFDIREKTHPYFSKIVDELSSMRCVANVNLDRAEKSIGTLGGGNHFIELDEDDEGTKYLVIHTGSRHLGVEVASHYQERAYSTLNSASDEDVEALVAKLKAAGKQRQIQQEIAKLRNTKRTNVPKDLTYLEGAGFDDYVHDMRIAQKFAWLNREAIADVIVAKMGFKVVDSFTTIHNYVDTEHMILRKGAVSAMAGEKLIIPINMRDGSLLCTGKGNADWNESAPHGAGRLMSRAKAKAEFNVESFKESMEGIYTTSVGLDTLDECPMAYKPISAITENVGDTVSIDKIIKPVYNFKAGGD